WYAAAFSREGSAFLATVARENWFRYLDPDADTGHAHGAGYLFSLALVGLLPWTPLLPLGVVPLGRERTPAANLAEAWVGTGLVFFGFAASKRSVYLLPLYPAVALLVGAGVVAAPAEGGAVRAARGGARLYAPALVLLAALAAALAVGLDPGPALRRWLRPADAMGAAAPRGRRRAPPPLGGRVAPLARRHGPPPPPARREPRRAAGTRSPASRRPAAGAARPGPRAETDAAGAGLRRGSRRR